MAGDDRADVVSVEEDVEEVVVLDARQAEQGVDPDLAQRIDDEVRDGVLGAVGHVVHRRVTPLDVRVRRQPRAVRDAGGAVDARPAPSRRPDPRWFLASRVRPRSDGTAGGRSRRPGLRGVEHRVPPRRATRGRLAGHARGRGRGDRQAHRRGGGRRPRPHPGERRRTFGRRTPRVVGGRPWRSRSRGAGRRSGRRGRGRGRSRSGDEPADGCRPIVSATARSSTSSAGHPRSSRIATRSPSRT